LVAVGLALSLPVLGIGLHDDDFLHRLGLSGRHAEYRRDLWSLYEFVPNSVEASRLIDHGLLPWFADPELRTRFFRPLSSALIALDVELFGDWAFPAYVHSLIWFSLVLWLVVRIHRSVLPERAAFWASLSYGVAGAHAATTSWIAARHVLVGAVFGLAAFAVSLSHRDARGRAALGSGLASAALVAGGLFASEAALSAVALLLSELWLGRRGARRERLQQAVPIVVVTLAYLGFYALAGYGTRRMGSYVSPFETPGLFVVAVLKRLPLLLEEAFLGVPCAIGQLGAVAHWTLWPFGVASAVAVLWWFRRAVASDPTRRLGWIPLGLFGALVPFAGPILDGRVLVMPLLASSMLVGVILAERGPSAQVPRWASTVLLIVFGISPLARVVMTWINGNSSRIELAMVSRAKIRCPPGGRIYVVNAADPAIGLYSGPLFLLAGADWRSWHVLSVAPTDLELEAQGARSLVLRTPEPRRTSEFEWLARASVPAVGSRVRVQGLRAEVRRSSGAGVTEALFELEEDLDSGCLVRWNGGADGFLESLTLPAQGTLKLQHEPGPLGI
jgi:hypothetical protein